jgi:hypothetical protein
MPWYITKKGVALNGKPYVLVYNNPRGNGPNHITVFGPTVHQQRQLMLTPTNRAHVTSTYRHSNATKPHETLHFGLKSSNARTRQSYPWSTTLYRTNSVNKHQQSVMPKMLANFFTSGGVVTNTVAPREEKKYAQYLLRRQEVQLHDIHSRREARKKEIQNKINKTQIAIENLEKQIQSIQSKPQMKTKEKEIQKRTATIANKQTKHDENMANTRRRHANAEQKNKILEKSIQTLIKQYTKQIEVINAHLRSLGLNV